MSKTRVKFEYDGEEYSVDVDADDREVAVWKGRSGKRYDIEELLPEFAKGEE